ncbi:MAG: TonB-dependent receptor plug domain-containing protein [Myxococcales bacterium]|nr:TonB-dependent receptor plug domain-containing protein [Myxococcales bacterium]
MSRAFEVTACVVSLVTSAAAQGTTITGRVVDEAGLPIEGATILLHDEAATTADDGTFTITAAPGSLTVIASGFVARTLPAKGNVVVRLVRVSGEVIEISGRAPEESKPLAYTMSAKDVASTPGAMNDALRAITILPAAARIPFSFGGVVLRGMSPRDSSVFIDGVEIPLAFHFGGITAVFPTQMLEDMRVVPSGFDVSLGRTQGGVVELTTRAPRGDAYRVGGEVSLLHSQVSAEGPAPRDGAFLVSLRRSYFDLFLRPFVSRNDPHAELHGRSGARAVGEAGKRGQLAAYVIGSLDRIANSTDAAKPNDIDAQGHVAVNLGFLRAGTTYKRKIDQSLFTLAPMLGSNILTLFTKEYDENARAKVLDISRRWYLFGGRGEWLRDDPHGFLHAGVDVSGGYIGRISQPKTADTDNDVPLPRNTVLWTDAAVFVEARRHWYGDRISIRPGLRLDRFGLGERWALDPRINAHVTPLADGHAARVTRALPPTSVAGALPTSSPTT